MDFESGESRAAVRRRRCLLFGVIVVAASARFIPLGAKCLWLDEAISAFYLNFSFREILAVCEAPGSLHPPLFFVLLREWSRAWGDSEFALRALPALCGTLSVVGLYLLVRQLEAMSLAQGRPRAGAATLAAALLALSPLQIHLSQIVRQYTLATALLLFQNASLLRSLRREGPTRSPWILVSALSIAATYTHNIAFIFVACQAAFAALALAAAPRLRRGACPGRLDPVARSPTARSVRRTRVAIAAIVMISIALAPRAASALRQCAGLMPGVPAGGRIPERARALGIETLLSLTSAPATGVSPSPGVAWTVTVFLFGAIAASAYRGGRAEWFLLSSTLAPALILADLSVLTQRPIYSSYYLCFLQMHLLAYMAFVVSGLRGLLRGVFRAALVGGSLLACGTSLERVGFSAAPSYRGALRHVSSEGVADEPVIVRGPQLYFGAAYYTRDAGRPLLWVDRGPTSRFFGIQYLRASDVVGDQELRELDCPSFWLIGTEEIARDRPVALYSRSYELTEEVWFVGDGTLLPWVVVQHYSRRPGLDSRCLDSRGGRLERENGDPGGDRPACSDRSTFNFRGARRPIQLKGAGAAALWASRPACPTAWPSSSRLGECLGSG